MIKFKFSAITRSFPGLVFLGGLALTIISSIADLSSGLVALGVFLMLLSAGLYVLYLYLRSKSNK